MAELFLVSVYVVDHGNNLLKSINFIPRIIISFSFLKDGVQYGRGFIIINIQQTPWFSFLNSNS